MTRRSRALAPIAALLLLAFVSPLVLPDEAEAQFRRRGRIGYVQPPYAPWPWWGPYPYGPYLHHYVDYGASSLRIQTHPEDADVYVDGFLAGTVDEFNGIFQRLRLTPGGHEIAIFHEGYRTFRRRLYLRPAGDQTLKVELVPLGPGETAEVPAPPPEPVDPPAAVADPARQEVDEASDQAVARLGTLVLRIDPADAEVLIDGKAVDRLSPDGPVTLELGAGRHTVEVRRSGYRSFVQDVLIRRDVRLPLSVRLERN